MIEVSGEQYRVVTLAERPELKEVVLAEQGAAWPEFMMHEPVSSRYWHQLLVEWPQFQMLLWDEEKGRIAAAGHTIPLLWSEDIRQLPDTGWDWGLQTGMTQTATVAERNQLCGLSITLAPAYRGAGLSQQMVAAMKQLGQTHGFEQLILPVRPTLKNKYPLTPMSNYVQWTNESGLPFDPWLRVHIRAGAKLVKVCPRAMTVTGSVAEWESWTGLRFPESGLYVMDGALVPLKITVEKDQGVYVEPNVWVVYDLA